MSESRSSSMRTYLKELAIGECATASRWCKARCNAVLPSFVSSDQRLAIVTRKPNKFKDFLGLSIVTSRAILLTIAHDDVLARSCSHFLTSRNCAFVSARGTRQRASHQRDDLSFKALWCRRQKETAAAFRHCSHFVVHRGDLIQQMRSTLLGCFPLRSLTAVSVQKETTNRRVETLVDAFATSLACRNSSFAMLRA